MLNVLQEEIPILKEGDKKKPHSAFEALLDQYSYQRPKRGQILEGEIEAIQEDAIILDVGLKRAAIVANREVREMDTEHIASLSVGDVIPVQVTRTPIGDQDLIVSIEAAQEYQSWQNASALLDEGCLVKLEIIGSNKGGILVDYQGLEGFIPNSHLPGLRNRQREEMTQQKREMLGQRLAVKALEVNPDRNRLVFSAREARREQRQQRLENLDIGDVITGKVVGLVHFGVFIDLGGIDGLVHTSELDWADTKRTDEIAALGDEMQVQVIGIDRERERIQLSRKALMPNPWEEIESCYVPGDLVEVEILRVVEFGAFARLPQGIHGLIHNTQLGYTIPGSEGASVKPGMKALVKILRIEPERERIALSMRQVPMEKQVDWMLDDYEDEENREL